MAFTSEQIAECAGVLVGQRAHLRADGHGEGREHQRIDAQRTSS